MTARFDYPFGSDAHASDTSGTLLDDEYSVETIGHTATRPASRLYSETAGRLHSGVQTE